MCTFYEYSCYAITATAPVSYTTQNNTHKCPTRHAFATAIIPDVQTIIVVIIVTVVVVIVFNDRTTLLTRNMDVSACHFTNVAKINSFFTVINFNLLFSCT